MYVVGHCVSQSIEQSLNALWRLRLRLRLSHFVSKILLIDIRYSYRKVSNGGYQ